MTEAEAIKELKVKYLGDSDAIVEAKELAIKALEKQIAKKPKITRTSALITFGICPNCGTEIDRLDNPFYHKDADCLQKLDWSKEE